MMQQVKIKGNGKNNVLSVDLSGVLCLIENGSQYRWAIFYLEAVVNPNTINVLEFENQIYNSKYGYPISFDDLAAFSKIIFQTIEIVLIGEADEHRKMIRYELDDFNSYYTHTFCLELVDSSYWEVRSTDEAFIKRIRDTFEGVTDL